MADRKISELTNITGANLADDDEFALVDTSADETKAITFGEFKTALDTATGFVRITGDTMTGNLTVPNVVVSGNVDGRDVSADGTKLDGIEAGADVTDTTNVTAAGALMDSELSNLAAVKAINQGLSTSDSPSFDAVTVGSTSDPSSEMTILSSIGGTSELRLGDTDADAGSIKYFNSNDQLVLRAAAATRVIFSSTGAAITGKTTTDELDLNAIAATISDTAVDIFVYDTRKDSDGGAWRKRTQNTSWYNETLNTSTRGSRKEFPAVAVIVAESTQLTIYDGDDPDLPMWMVFNLGTSFMINLAGTTRSIQAVTALNGVMVVPLNGGANNGTTIVKFVEDFGYEIGAGYQRYGTANAKIADRNVNATTFLQLSSVGIVAGESNDVALTVLPNAPIDAATGLPVPTIAVATGGGTSIIRDDGTVVDYTLGNYTIVNVDFDYDNNVLQTSRNIGSGGGALYVNKFPILTADNNSGTIQQELVLSSTAGDNTSGLDFIRTPFIEGTKNVVGMKASTLAFSSDAGAVQGVGIYQLGPDGTTKTTTLGAAISSDYNTGWMNGDIKLATLSDTDDTNVTGSELVTNGTFDSDTAWTKGTGWTISGGKATHTQSSGGGELYQEFNVVAGNTYVMSFTIDTTGDTSIYNTSIGFRSTGGSYLASISSSNNFGDIAANTASQRFSITYYASSSITVRARIFSDDDLSIDDWSVRLAEEDRSVNGNGLQVFGTVTKSAVATGADLVSFGGFNGTSIYLEQPYNSDLDFGTGDFSVMGWFKTADEATARCLISRYQVVSDQDYTGFNITLFTGGVLYLYTKYANSASNTPTSGLTALDDNAWHHFVANRHSSGLMQIYVDGELYNSTSATVRDISVSTDQDPLRIGAMPRFNQSGMDNLALMRISATIPSPEQIKKIYEDEKVLFQDGAQATLYGSSDAVTALAHDDSTDLLHVGTSAGRSSFQGLRRVDNTTTAVGAAISASNGLVADE